MLGFDLSEWASSSAYSFFLCAETFVIRKAALVGTLKYCSTYAKFDFSVFDLSVFDLL